MSSVDLRGQSVWSRMTVCIETFCPDGVVQLISVAVVHSCNVVVCALYVGKNVVTVIVSTVMSSQQSESSVLRLCFTIL